MTHTKGYRVLTGHQVAAHHLILAEITHALGRRWSERSPSGYQPTKPNHTIKLTPTADLELRLESSIQITAGAGLVGFAHAQNAQTLWEVT